MSPNLPTGRAGHGLALALVAGLAAAGWFAAAAPLLARYAEQEDALLRQQALHRRMAEVAAELPALQRAVQTPQAVGLAPALLEGGTDAVAAAALQESLRDVAAQAGATLFSVETLPASESGAYRRIGLRLSLAARWPVLMRMLQAIERARPGMAVDDLELRQTQMGTGEEDALMSAALTVYAFRDGVEPRRTP